MSISYKSPKGDMRIRILVLTSNELKAKEFDKYLGQKYGANVIIKSKPTILDEQVLADVQFSPHFILIEESTLYNRRGNQYHADSMNLADGHLVLFNSELKVYKPIYENNLLVKLEKVGDYNNVINGHINLDKRVTDENVLGWDDIFILSGLGKSIHELTNEGFDKCSPRQNNIARFVYEFLVYKKLKNFSHIEQFKPTKVIDFNESMSVTKFMTENKYLNNEKLSIWNLKSIISSILGEGIFVKVSSCRPIGNYFLPPFAGIPLTPKESNISETIFFMHDFFHHLIPDLVVDIDDDIEIVRKYNGTIDKKCFMIYHFWRLMSEAVTMVMADMFYANTLVLSDPENIAHVNKDIYGLFLAIDIDTLLRDNDRVTVMKMLLWANVKYALTGDDSEWAKLIIPGKEDKLIAYKNHFEKFFVGDHQWTFNNFWNMINNKHSFQKWVNKVGKDIFIKNNVPLLSDKLTLLESINNDPQLIIKKLFEDMFNNKILGAVECSLTNDETNKSFSRYMLGQSSFYMKYEKYCDNYDTIIRILRESSFTDKNKIRKLFNNDVLKVFGLGLIDQTTAEQFMDIHPLFEPNYISYKQFEGQKISDKFNGLTRF